MHQMFQFLTEITERYTTKASCLKCCTLQVDRIVPLLYQGLNALSYAKDGIIEQSAVHFQFQARQRTWCLLSRGVCTCQEGQYGSQCSHQAAVVCTLAALL